MKKLKEIGIGKFKIAKKNIAFVLQNPQMIVRFFHNQGEGLPGKMARSLARSNF